MCLSPLGHKESDTTERLNGNNKSSCKLGFPGGSEGKNPPANAGHMDSSSGLGRSSGEGNGHWLQYSCLGNPMTREAGGLQSQGPT